MRQGQIVKNQQDILEIEEVDKRTYNFGYQYLESKAF